MVHEFKAQSFSAAMAGVSAVMGFAAPWPHVIAGLFFAIAGIADRIIGGGAVTMASDPEPEAVPAA